MGNLLRVLTKDDSAKNYDAYVDFENAQPTEIEIDVWAKVNEVLLSSNSILVDMANYHGAAEEIRLAISFPQNEEHQENAWLAVYPMVLKLKEFYEFSISLENVIPVLLRELCSSNLTSRQHLETQQALFKQFAEILDFVLKFDDLKMTTPAIQNDFSYYRRTVSRKRMANDDSKEGETEVSNEMANRMSLFYAHATPMLKTLSDTTTKFVTQLSKNSIGSSRDQEDPSSVGLCFFPPGASGCINEGEHKDLPVEITTDCLSTMANICREMTENPNYCSRFKNEETKWFCLRVMVGVIILYDHVHPVGAFAKNSGIDVKRCLKLLKDQDSEKVEVLLNAIRYTTLHLNDESTPRSIKCMLAN